VEGAFLEIAKAAASQEKDEEMYKSIFNLVSSQLLSL